MVENKGTKIEPRYVPEGKGWYISFDGHIDSTLRFDTLKDALKRINFLNNKNKG